MFVCVFLTLYKLDIGMMVRVFANGGTWVQSQVESYQ